MVKMTRALKDASQDKEESVVLKVYTKRVDNVKVRQLNVAEIIESEQKNKQKEVGGIMKVPEKPKEEVKDKVVEESEYEDEVESEFERAEEEVKLE